jgi:hypothetical protein
MKKYPFKFLDAYTKEDEAIFFGREDEIEELYRLAFETNLLLVYGASGTGKTSLIRCGLANKFQSSQWLDLYIRRGTDINQSLLDTVVKNTPATTASANEEVDATLDWFESMMQEEQSEESKEAGIQDFSTENPIAQALQELYLATFTPVYLIFDQFEELYTLGNQEEQSRFVDNIEELVKIPIPLKIVIVMREEYLARLYELEKRIPQLRNKKLRIEPMDMPRVQQVILSATAQNPDSNIGMASGEEMKITKAIVEKIREGDVNIKLPYLQVFMDRLYETATGEAFDRQKDAMFTLDLVNQMGTIGDVLSEFIERQSQLIYRNLSKQFPNLPVDVVWQILSPFATVDGTKVPIRQKELSSLINISSAQKSRGETEQIIKEAIVALENRRILRYRKEDDVYEVAHDTLALQIAEKRSEEEKAYLKAKRLVTEGYASYLDTSTLLSREQLAFISPYEERLEHEIDSNKQAFIKASANKRLRQRMLLWSGVVAAFAIAIFVIFTVINQQQQTQEALDNFLEAQSKREKVELSILLQDAAQISKGNNCPPHEMKAVIDSLYQKYNEEAQIRQEYTKTMELLSHCY